MKIIITESQFKRLIENIIIDYKNNSINIINEQDNNRTLELLKKKAPMDEWFYENIVNKVKQITYPEFPDNIFYIDKNTNQALMVYNKKNGYFWINYYKIWSYFESNYSHNDMEIRQLIKDLMGEHYGLGNIARLRKMGNIDFEI